MSLETHNEQAIRDRRHTLTALRQFVSRERDAADERLMIEEMRVSGFKKTIAILDQLIAEADQELVARIAADEATAGSDYEEPY